MKPGLVGPERVCHMRRNYLLLLAIFVLLPATAIWAQGLTGALIGSVRDEQGGALQGAVVRVTSPALIGKLSGPKR